MATIRPIEASDIDACVAFGIESFRPVFASFEHGYGSELFNALRPNWEHEQTEYIRAAVSDDSKHTFVAVVDGAVAGFAVLVLEPAGRLGEIELMAVDPAQQGSGVGTTLTTFAVTWFRDQGMTHAMVATGDDEGHAPARAAYGNGGFEVAAIQPVLMTREL